MRSTTILRIVLTAAVLGFSRPGWGQIDIANQATAKTDAKQWLEAEALWEQATKANPTQADYWFQLGFCRVQLRKYREAIPNFQHADALGVTYRWAMPYRIARCYALAGDKEQAIAWLTRAIDRGYRFLSFIVQNDDFKGLRNDARFRKLTATDDLSKLDRNAGWRYDVWLYARELRRRHYDPYRYITKEAFEDYVRTLHRDIPHLTDNQIRVRIWMLARKMGDGHTGFRNDFSNDCLPVRFYFFDEGPYVIAADPAYADLLGAKVLRFGSITPAQALEALDKIIPRDNTMTTLDRAPNFLRQLPLLNGLGLIPGDKQMSLTIQDAKGVKRTITLPALDTGNEENWRLVRETASNPPPLTFAHRDKDYWFQYLPESKMVFFQFNAVEDQGKETFQQFCERMFTFIDENDVQRLVIDLRWNGGGNNFLNQPLIEGLIRSAKINRQDRLFTIIGRSTFSAAMCCAAQIERYSKAIFVGEPTGSSPNFVGEAPGVTLPYSKMTGAISDLYWQNSVAMDYRTWIAPALYAPPTWAAYRQNRDPAMEAILNYLAAKGGN